MGDEETKNDQKIFKTRDTVRQKNATKNTLQLQRNKTNRTLPQPKLTIELED